MTTGNQKNSEKRQSVREKQSGKYQLSMLGRICGKDSTKTGIKMDGVMDDDRGEDDVTQLMTLVRKTRNQ